MTHKDRLKQFIKNKGLSDKCFSEKVGLSYGYLTHKGDLGSSKIENIVSCFPELNIDWLLTGKGEMLRTPPQESPQPVQVLSEDPCAERLERIKEYKERIVELKEGLKGKDETITLLKEKIETLTNAVKDFKKDTQNDMGNIVNPKPEKPQQHGRIL